MSVSSEEDTPLSIIKATIAKEPDSVIESSKHRSKKQNADKRQNCRKPKVKCNRCKKKLDTYDIYTNHYCCKPTTYLCDICKRPYSRFKRLITHIEKHLMDKEDIRKEFKCDMCDEVFTNLRKIQDHLLRVHHGYEFRCDKCHKLFSSQARLSRHKCEEPVPCPVCGKMFTKKYFLKKHCLSHSNTALRCIYCYNIFIKEDSYNIHISKLNCSKTARNYWLKNYDPTKCRECQIVFSSEQELIQHFGCSHPGEPHQCFWCERQLESLEELRLHVHRHNVERFTCVECNIAYTSQEGFRKHRLKHKKSQFKCQYCGTEYLSTRRTTLHEGTCKRNPKFGLQLIPDEKSEKRKKSRQLNWESRIIVKKVREGTDRDEQITEMRTSNFELLHADDDSLSDRKGWFDDYYRTSDDNVPFSQTEDFPSDVENVDIPEAVTSSSEDSSGDSGDEVEQEIEFNHKLCRLCDQVFTLEYELLHHYVKVHPGEMPHQCPHCEIKAPLFAQLKEHMKIHGVGLGVHHCGTCSKSFKSEARGKKHTAKCRGDVAGWPKIKICRRCGKSFQTKCGYKRHKKTACKREKKIVHKEELPVLSDGDSWQADDPEPEPEVEKEEEPKVIESRPDEVVQSSKPVPDVRQNTFQCRLCSATFPFERGLVMHFKAEHPGIKPLICPHCGVALADKLKEHLKTHGIGEEFICELCGKRFNQKFMSKIHELWHEGIEYKCLNCKQKFLSEEKMTHHVSSAKCSKRQSLMRLPCDVCGRYYRSRFGLKNHYLTHTPRELRPVKQRMNCEYCGKWFESNNALQRHRRIHTGEKPFCCRFCPRAFAQEGNCKAHERLHTGEAKPRKKKTENSGDTTIYVCATVNQGVH